MSTAKALSLSAEDFQALNSAEQRQVARQLIDIANKRYQRGVEKWGEFDALREYAKATEKRAKVGKTIHPMQKGKQSITGKKGKQLYKEFQIAQQFLQNKTSTEKGREQAKRRFEKSIGRKMDVQEFRLMWDAYEDLRKLHKKGLVTLENQMGSADFLQQFFDEVSATKSGISKKQIRQIYNRIKAQYKNTIQEEKDWDEYSRIMAKDYLTDEDIEILRRYEEQYGWEYQGIIQ